MKDEAEAGLLYESQSKLMGSRRLLGWYTCTVQYSDGCRAPCLRDMDAAGTKPLGSLVEEVEEDSGRRRRRDQEGRTCDRPPLPTVVPIPSFG